MQLTVACGARSVSVLRETVGLRESAEIPTGVKEVLTLLVKSRWSISTAIEVSFNRGMYAVSLAFQRHM